MNFNISLLQNHYILKLANFLAIFSMILIGVVVRNLWDVKIKLGIVKVLLGSLFFAIIIFTIMTTLGQTLNLVSIPSLLVGLKCNDLMTKYIKSKDDCDPLDRLN